jgi:hypothetical protein
MYTIPHIDNNLKVFAKNIGCVWIGAVSVIPKPLCKELNCHNNVINYINKYGGVQKLGYYFIKNIDLDRYEAILHSLVYKNEKLLDITPFNDERIYNIVGITNNTNILGLSPFIVQ